MNEFKPITLPSRPLSPDVLKKVSTSSGVLRAKLDSRRKKVLRRTLRDGRLRIAPRTMQSDTLPGAVKG